MLYSYYILWILVLIHLSQKIYTILLLLKELANHNIDVCKYIMKYKHSIEESETLNYHIHRWKTIAKCHYNLHETHEENSHIYSI